MRIIIDNGAYTLRNMGDVAMLQVAVNRARAVYPSAEILILTSRPDLLQRHCPGTLPISARARNAAFAPEHTAPGVDRSLALPWRRLLETSPVPELCPENFNRTLAITDILLVAGGGFLNDLNWQAALAVLRMLEEGLRQGKRVALFSQGLGPLSRPDLVGLLERICREGAYIGLREPRRGVELLKAGRAADDRWKISGDDALDLACARFERPAIGSSGGLGGALGFSVRTAGYSGITPAHQEALSGALNALRHRTGAEVLPIPISFNDFEDDAGTIATVIGQPVDTARLETPEALLRNARQCRVILAGTYHAAVFALGQGVPCLCFHASGYYRDKMEGLAAQFGEGCQVLDLHSGGSAPRIAEVAYDLWERADFLSAELLARARQQVAEARAFYRTALAAEHSGVLQQAIPF